MLPGLARRAEERWPGCSIVAVWDAKGDTFRHRLFPDYKAHRKEAPMAQDFVRAEAAAWQKMGHASYMAVDAEADDAAATLARINVEHGAHVVLVSSDKDWCQLIGPDVELMSPPDWELRDTAWVLNRFGVTPSQIPDYLALAGDAVDGIIGVPGIGPKKARELLEEHGKLEVIYAQLAELPDGLRCKLETHRSAARLARMLAKLRDDVELVRF